MTICYFGNYDPTYSRNRILMKGLTMNGVEVLECNDRSRGLLKYVRLLKKHWKIRNRYHVMIVGFPGHQAMVLARLLTRKPIIFDAFLSLYDSLVFDRGLYKPGGLSARYYKLLDKISCRLADAVLLDTQAHISYFNRVLGLPIAKFKKIFVGADDEVFYPQKKEKRFTVHFHGKFIPLQGVEYIVRAAEILKDRGVVFNILGKGQTYPVISQMVKDLNLKNINFIEPVPYYMLPEYILQADVCLGIFGKTDKAKRVIPNKVFECAAMKKPIITGESPAVKELFADRESVLFVRMADAQDLADKILELKADSALRQKLAEGAYRTFVASATPVLLGRKLKEIIQEITRTHGTVDSR